MPPDKYSATWVSHSSINDFLQCSRAYYLKHVYKDPKTGKKVKVISPPLSLGASVHTVIESLSNLETSKRFKTSLIEVFDKVWKQYEGEKGGFISLKQQNEYYERGRQMLHKIMKNPGPLLNLAIKVKSDLPQYWLSESEEIMLSGKIDWLEYLPETDSVHIIDFKTSKSVERSDSMQLPIYHLLVHNVQHRKVTKASYWYLELADGLQEQELPDLLEAHEQVLSIAKKIKLARKLERFVCPYKGCFACRPYEAVLRGEAKQVGIDNYGLAMYILPSEQMDIADLEQESVIM